MEEWADACADADLAEGAMVVLGDADDPVAVARAGGRLYAFDDTCTHEECPLSDGMLSDGEVECPCHGSIFNLRTGEALTGPALESVRTHRVRVEDGRVQVLIDR
jgi:3-phenylpropionate/trans-cinnamate dioxygenase ferredoxin component